MPANARQCAAAKPTAMVFHQQIGAVWRRHGASFSLLNA
jgi:hypothetical protein